MKNTIKKTEFICESCGGSYLAYSSTRRGKTQACSKKCSAKLRKNKGKDNPNYKHGNHCDISYCNCGNIKDYRALKCSNCTRFYKPEVGYTSDLDGIKKAIANSESFVEAAKRCGLDRKTIRQVVTEECLDITHFIICSTRPSTSEDIFKIHTKRVNQKVRRHVINNELLEYKCDICDQEDSWQGKNLTLQLDHINGISTDNRLENLRFLCPNCHTQTATFCGRNKNAIRNK